MTNGLPTTRRIFRTQATSNSELRELLEAILVSELLMPSETIWLVSPWITDLDILDNRGGAFSALVPTWGLRRVRISEVFGAILDRSRICVVTRPDDHNDAFLNKMRDFATASAWSTNLSIVARETLHSKGLLGQDYYLCGSMNLTYKGIEINDEAVSFERSPDAIATARIHFQENYEANQ